MNALERIDELARLARQEQTPQTDVSGAVFARLRRRPQPTLQLLPMSVAAGISALAAVAVLVRADLPTSLANDPLVSVFQQMEKVIP